MGRLPTMLLVLGCALPSDVTSQAVERGSQLSVMMESPNPFEGQVRRAAEFDRVEGNTLWVTTREGSVPLPLETAEPMVLTGGHHGTVGAVLGMLAGTTVGALMGYASYSPELVQRTECEYPWPGAMPRNCRTLGMEDIGSRTGETLTGAAVGFWVGLAGGYVIGRMAPTWERLDVETLRVGPDGVGLGLTARF